MPGWRLTAASGRTASTRCRRTCTELHQERTEPMASDEGIVREVDNGYELRFERHFEQPVEEVWQAITEPEHLADWLGTTKVDLNPGGRIRIDEAGGAGIDGEVLA